MTVLPLPQAPLTMSDLGTAVGELGTEWTDRYTGRRRARKPGRLLRYLRTDRALPQLIRFALVGGTSNITYVLLFLTMTAAGPLAANIVGSVVSTVLANELHRRLTFHAADRVGWFTAQWEGGGLALVGLGISTAALAALGFWVPGLGELGQATAVLAITAAVGGLRFLALRGLVF
ncbi:GtrA family protein [Nocardia paucivorans]|uniref:GtrA family protein n=1 Tax=Nocardia paucivorans TaxID=114259 RepID=UPI0002F667E6|nr:GtrA family protein [Nocardia paucivorans]